ncbi:hypothetical protein Cgig2_003086 [Carnegiea gigantea]|uniref:PPC domain-containing protein n=1 Tax=Carnegiea gigantea TaxID=171969 RepID=A0A9Q1JGZ9_9CARY|nr:hypothetical protein Cgig2_003086 [Carnegiea gigantea]
MKGEYAEDQDENHHHHHHHHYSQSHNPINMFPKFPPPHHFSHSFLPKDSEEADSAASLPPASAAAAPSKKPKTSAEDGGTVEVARRPRGRPPGSKNKPKPPIVITRENEPPMAPYILEISGGSDIVDSLTRFTRRRGVGMCVLTASGAVTNVTLRQPSTAAPAGTVTFHGRFDILCLSAVLLNTAPFNNNNGGFGFTISLAGPQGQIVGGKVVGPLLSSGTVYVIAASFNSPSYHRLPSDEQDAQNQAATAGGGGESSSPVSGGGDGGGGGGGPMGLYSCHLGSASSDLKIKRLHY